MCYIENYCTYSVCSGIITQTDYVSCVLRIACIQTYNVCSLSVLLNGRYNNINFKVFISMDVFSQNIVMGESETSLSASLLIYI